MTQNKQRLELRHSQTFAMTQTLKQSIEILQLSTLELRTFLSEELEKNPLLSQVEEEETQEMNNSLPQYSYPPIASARYDSLYDQAENYTRDKTLKEHIMEQIYVDISATRKRMIALHLTDMLNENGYLDVNYISLIDTIGVTNSELEDTIFELQKFDPIGVFARSLTECLTLQLKEKGELSDAMLTLLSNLELLAKRDIDKLQRVCNVNTLELREMIKEIQSLNPKPGNNFAAEVPGYIQPDVFLRKNGDKWVVELNQEILPRLLVNSRYYAEIKEKTNNKQEKKYITEQFNTANSLIKALDQRAQTILKVATEIVAKQKKFFERGINYLVPLTLADIASAADLHESTVSRVTTNKYISTPSGIFELKYFFSSALGNMSGADNHSSKSVKNLIKELISKEDKEILSDEKIVMLLKEKNIEIARRTVAKYREEMNIAPSSQRKKKRLLQAF
jgi:RNA polymerase sigma-54 factor